MTNRRRGYYGCITVVADDDVNFFSERLSPKLADHPLRAVEARYADAPHVQRQRKTPGAYPELQHRAFFSSPGQAGETLDRSLGLPVNSWIQ